MPGMDRVRAGSGIDLLFPAYRGKGGSLDCGQSRRPQGIIKGEALMTGSVGSRQEEQSTRKKKPVFRSVKFLAEPGAGKTLTAFDEKKVVFKQGDLANAVFYVLQGKVKLTVV